MLSIAFGTVLSRFNVALIGIIILVFTISNLLTVTTSDQARYGVLTRQRLIEKLNQQLNQRPYQLVTFGADPRVYEPYGGWRYLFNQYAYPPATSSADQFFGWLYPDQLNRTIPEVQVIIAENMDYKTDLPIEYQVKEGPFLGLIVELIK
jgi:CubicO group peptidase (beta-lactamase class C family)